MAKLLVHNQYMTKTTEDCTRIWCKEKGVRNGKNQKCPVCAKQFYYRDKNV